MNDVTEDLRQGRSVLLIIPDGHNLSAMWGLLREELLRLEFHIEDIWLPGLSVDQGVAVALGDALRIQWDSSENPRTLDNLLLSAQLPDIVHLEGFSELSALKCSAWASFSYQWAEANHRVADRGDTSSGGEPSADAPVQARNADKTEKKITALIIDLLPGGLTDLTCAMDASGSSGHAFTSLWYTERTTTAISGG